MKGAKEVVETFWQLMQTNDFEAASTSLAEDYELCWPQSSERILGRANFVAVNKHYPANGPWRFSIHRLLADGDEVVTDVGVTDGVVSSSSCHLLDRKKRFDCAAARVLARRIRPARVEARMGRA